MPNDTNKNTTVLQVFVLLILFIICAPIAIAIFKGLLFGLVIIVIACAFVYLCFKK